MPDARPRGRDRERRRSLFGLSGESKAALAGRLGVGGDIYLTRNLAFFLELSALLTTFDIADPTASQNLSLLYYLAPQGGLQWRF